ARGRARGGRRAAAGSGGTRGAGRFYGALAGQGAGRGGGETGPGRTAYGVHMMQAPMPPPLPGLDPNLVFNEVEPIIAAVVVIGVVAVALRWIFRTPVGEAIAERIRRRAQRRWGAESEDPERVAALEAQVAAAIADEKRLSAPVETEKKSAEDWERRAVLAVQEGRDDLAKQALLRHNEHAQGAVQLHETWVKHREETEKLKLSLRQLNDR